MSFKNIVKKALGRVQEETSLPALIREYYRKHGYEWQEANIIAIRAVSKKNDNTFSDCLAVVTDDEVSAYVCTTVPGTTWTDETRKKWKISQEGVFCLGFYPKLWTFGQHHGRALKQVGPCDWYIDADKDKKQGAKEKVYRDSICGMNVHRKPQDGAKEVGFASAGCIVTRYHSDLDDFLNRLGWITATAPKKTFNGFITDTESFPLAGQIIEQIILR
jgi:hypothetical protein